MKLKHDYTYQAKDEIKKLGGKWDRESQSWEVPDENFDKALLACLKEELKFWESKSADPENEAGDLDAIDKYWATWQLAIIRLKNWRQKSND